MVSRAVNSKLGEGRIPRQPIGIRSDRPQSGAQGLVRRRIIDLGPAGLQAGDHAPPAIAGSELGHWRQPACG